MAYEIKEDIYGHKKRISFIEKNIPKGSKVLDFGCGTGARITIPLALKGINIKGIDLNSEGIKYGHDLIDKEKLNLPKTVLETKDIFDEPDQTYDVIIASEVLEHIHDVQPILDVFHKKLKPGGRIIITVPNGYGWFEFEDLLWTKLGLGWVFRKTGILKLCNTIRWHLYKDLRHRQDYHSSIDNSPHVQRFTKKNLTKLLKKHSFKVNRFTGSVLFAGLISNMLFSGNRWIMKINNAAGDKVPRIASGFFVVAERQ